MTDRRLLVLLYLAVMGLGGLTLTACNTVEGVGEDVEAVGEGIDDAADGD